MTRCLLPVTLGSATFFGWRLHLVSHSQALDEAGHRRDAFLAISRLNPLFGVEVRIAQATRRLYPQRNFLVAIDVSGVVLAGGLAAVAWAAWARRRGTRTEPRRGSS
jgi:hypothetical protein